MNWLHHLLCHVGLHEAVFDGRETWRSYWYCARCGHRWDEAELWP